MTTAQTHQPVAYQIEDAGGEFMCLNRTKSTIRGIASKPLYAESALEKERTARIEAQQRLADMQELAAKAGLAHRKAEPVAWMWRVADSDWQLESTCPPERPLAIVEPLYTGYMADAYIGAREEVEIWKRLALEAEKRLQAEIARLTAENEALRAVVAEAVREALQEARKACENLPAPDSCSGVERSLWDVATMACAEAVGKVGAT